MPVTGINNEKCNGCNICLTTCLVFRPDKVNKKVIFNDPDEFCNDCGQCIARCPQDAIMHDIDDEALEFEGVKRPQTIISYDELYKFIRAHRSIRLYKNKKVKKDDMLKIFDAMKYAPTAQNLRSERFSVVSDPAVIKQLNDAVIEQLNKNATMHERYGDLFRRIGKIFNSPVYFDAPHIVFVESDDDDNMEENNIGIIITYGRLAAQSLGLGTCWNGWTQIAMHDNSDIKKIVNITGKRVGVFMLGYPGVRYLRSPPRSSKVYTGIEELE
jgi:nitroreductase/NAD-dependent dihydropyrimidine dehydrogenase PreA subunit